MGAGELNERTRPGLCNWRGTPRLRENKYRRPGPGQDKKGPMQDRQFHWRQLQAGQATTSVERQLERPGGGSFRGERDHQIVGGSSKLLLTPRVQAER